MGSAPLKGKRGPLSEGSPEGTKQRTVWVRGQHDWFECLAVEVLFYLRFSLAVYLPRNLKLTQPVYSSQEGFFSLRSNAFPYLPNPEVSHAPTVNNMWNWDETLAADSGWSRQQVRLRLPHPQPHPGEIRSVSANHTTQEHHMRGKSDFTTKYQPPTLPVGKRHV